MELFLIRHAHAVALGEPGAPDDFSRPLSAEGEAQVRAVAEGLRQKGITFEKIVTSPLVRARQTADLILSTGAHPDAELLPCDDLAPGGRTKKLARYLRKLEADRIALVGHQPDLGQWAAWLIGGKQAQLGLAKAGMAYIACEVGPAKGAGTLMWLVTPEWFAPQPEALVAR